VKYANARKSLVKKEPRKEKWKWNNWDPASAVAEVITFKEKEGETEATVCH
jgi:hypothetical protein